MTWDTVQQLLRIILQLAAGWLLNQGIITEEMSTTLVGSLLSIGGIAWWALWERSRPSA
jgi:hypothetical protein